MQKEKDVPYPFFTKDGEIQSAAEIEALAHFAEAALFYLPQQLLLWPAGIRSAALGFMLQFIGEGIAAFSIDAKARQAAKDAYLKLFGHGGGIACFLEEDGSDGCWARDIRRRAMQEPLPKILLEYLAKPLPAPYAPRPWSGQLSYFTDDAVSNYLQGQILAGAITVLINQHGPIDVSLVDAKAICEASPGMELSLQGGRLSIKASPTKSKVL